MDDTGARLDLLHVATETITLTRTFGMVPASRGDIVAPALLDRVVVAANAFVKAGSSLDPALLEGTTLVAVKRFYAAAREVPWLDQVLKSTRLRERAWRCASHVAFYALQEHQRRCTVIPAIVSAMRCMPLSTVREKSFPSKEFLDDARKALMGAGLPPGCLSTAYLSNIARHARHLLAAALRLACSGLTARCITGMAAEPARLAGIAVELVDARGTSKRCSACGTIGNRHGKTFSCTNVDCEKMVDSDLNGSRNVRTAPTSQRLHAKGEGARYRPLACRASTSLSLDGPGVDVQVRQSLK